MNDIRRIAFVSQRYLELQGLGPACFGGVLILSVRLHEATGASGRYGGAFQALVFAMLAAGYATNPLRQMYRRSFGDLVTTPRQRWLAGLPLQAVYFGALADILLSIDRPRSGPSLAAVALVAQSLWIVVRDWRWRAHYLAAATGGVAAMIATGSTPASPDQWGIDPARSQAFLLAYTLMGLGIALSGLLDHRLLVSTLGGVAGEASVKRSRPADRPLFGASVALAAAVPASFCLLLPDNVLPAAQLLVFTIGLVLAAGALATRQVVVAIRAFGGRGRPTDDGLRVPLDPDVVTALMAVVIAAAAEGALFPGQSPTLLTAAIGLAGGWLAVTGWTDRKQYVAWPIVATFLLAIMPRVQPARAFALFVLAMAAALLLSTLVGRSASSHRFDHADTI